MSFTEVFVLLVAAHVDEWKHRDRGNLASDLAAAADSTAARNAVGANCAVSASLPER
jgi:hypothetical protein